MRIVKSVLAPLDKIASQNGLEAPEFPSHAVEKEKKKDQVECMKIIEVNAESAWLHELDKQCGINKNRTGQFFFTL